MQQRQIIKGLPTLSKVAKVCKVCNVGKHQWGQFQKKSYWSASEKLELIHGYLCGPILQTLTEVRGMCWCF